jgi:hypothetical protein
MTTQFDFSNAPEYAKSSDFSIFAFDGAPMPYTFSATKGKFFSPGDIDGQEILIMQILEWRWIKDSRYGRPPEYYLDVLFINQQSTISVVSFKRQPAKFISVILKSFSGEINNIYPYAVLLSVGCTQHQLGTPLQEKIFYLPDRCEWTWVDKVAFSDAAAWLEECRPQNPWILMGAEYA